MTRGPSTFPPPPARASLAQIIRKNCATSLGRYFRGLAGASLAAGLVASAGCASSYFPTDPGEDGFVLPSWNPPIQGRQLIEEHYAESSGTLLLRAIAYATGGKVGYIVGGYRYREGPDAGKFTLTLQLDVDGRWLIMSDMDNSNRRAP